MNIKLSRFALLLAALSLAGFAGAEQMDRPTGIRIGQRFILKPYVSLSAGYDSNVDSRKGGKEDVIWTVNPGLGIEYRGDSWLLLFNAYYQFNKYTKHNSTSENSYHGYGEDLAYTWSDSMPGERGWSFMLSEKYQQINQVDDIMMSDGRGYGRDRQEFKIAGGLERRITEKWHANVNANYYWLDYDKNQNMGMYGWDRWMAGAEMGYALSKWTDLLVSASYQGYTQDNGGYLSGWNGMPISDKSNGYSIMGGFGSYATERINYRLLGGWSRFEYGDGLSESDGFTYSANASWKITDTWNTMLLASSYFQPNEREYGASTRVDTISWGLGKSMVRGKLNATLDLCYRRESHEYSATGNYDYDTDVLSARLGLNYILNRFVTAFLRFEYLDSMGSGSSRGDYYDYDRFRATLGARLTY